MASQRISDTPAHVSEQSVLWSPSYEHSRPSTAWKAMRGGYPAMDMGVLVSSLYTDWSRHRSIWRSGSDEKTA